MANNHVHRQRCHRHQQQRPQSSLVLSLNAGISKPSTAKHCSRRLTNNSNSNNNRSLSTSTPPSSKPPTSAPSSSSSSVNSKSGGGEKKTKTGTTELVPNVVLASILGGFVAGVFLYSMNAVGRGDGNASEGDDPLAQLKAEAQEAREYRGRVEGGGPNGRMTPDEIRALESGVGAAEMMTDGEVVAVATPADIAAIEEEANLKIFRLQQQQNNNEEPKKKKAWWRFGF